MVTIDYRKELKNELQSLGRSQADLSRYTGIPYKRLQGFFCQYWFLAIEEERLVRNTLLLWNEEKNCKSGT